MILKDDWEKVFGNHVVKAGCALRRVRSKLENAAGAFQEAPIFWGSFPGSSTGLGGWGANSGNTVADFLLQDMFFGFSEQSFNPTPDIQWEDIEVYVADSWKIGPRMTFDYGVRYSKFVQAVPLGRFGLHRVRSEHLRPGARQRSVQRHHLRAGQRSVRSGRFPRWHAGCEQARSPRTTTTSRRGSDSPGISRGTATVSSALGSDSSSSASGSVRSSASCRTRGRASEFTGGIRNLDGTDIRPDFVAGGLPSRPVSTSTPTPATSCSSTSAGSSGSVGQLDDRARLRRQSRPEPAAIDRHQPGAGG